MLIVHRAERSDALIDPLADLLATATCDPFATELVAVPTRGVERWLAQRLAHRLGADTDPDAGVCANVDFPTPAALVARVTCAVTGQPPDADPWSRPVWPLLAVIDAGAGESWHPPLARWLGRADDDVRQGRRLALARRLATLFTDYGEQRPELLVGWAAGGDEDGAGGPLPPDLRWQRDLWVRLRKELGVPSPAERLVEVTATLREPTCVALPALPDRVSVFGPSRVAEHHLRVLAALARHRDVHLWLVHPSAGLWDRLARADIRDATGAGAAIGHPLLASTARDLVDLQQRLRTAGIARDLHHPAGPPPPTMLGSVQQALRADSTAGSRTLAAPHDRSVQVHSCHGRVRQVEVLREVLVGLFADDPTLEPRDVLVMCPDIETFAPLVSATFGRSRQDPTDDGTAVGEHPGQRWRVQIADRSPRRTNPVLALLADILELADGRLGVTAVLDLLGTDAVRRRFGFTDDELERIRRWAGRLGVSWGEDARRRATFGLPDIRQGTWQTALDRILLGVAMAEEDYRFVGSALPLGDVSGADLDLAGRLAEFVERLTAVTHDLAGVRPAGHWLDTLDRIVELLGASAPDQEWQLVQAHRMIAELRAEFTGSGPPLRPADVRAWLAAPLAGRPDRAGFRTGALTVCSLEPMRAVPHRVICLLGMDDGVFPRVGVPDGDDLLARRHRPGERDQAAQERQLFLDAIGSAGEHLVVLYSGADERTGATRPPAVPVGELLDALDLACVTADGAPIRPRVLTRHPLHPTDPRNFTPGALGRPGPFSFDRSALGAAQASREVDRSAREEPGGPARPRVPLPALPRPDRVDLDDLIDLASHPARWFLRRRLQVWLPDPQDDLSDRLALELTGAAHRLTGEHLLAARLAGVDRARALAVQWRRGLLPPQQLGRAELERVVGQVIPLAVAAQAHAVGPTRTVLVEVDLPGGALISGQVHGVHETPESHGWALVRAGFAKLGARHRLRAWIQLLALAASHPGRQSRAVTIGRGMVGRRNLAEIAELSAPDPTVAAQLLDNLVRLRDRAEREPLPVTVGAGCAFAAAVLGGDSPEQALADAERVWAMELQDDPFLALCWGENARLAALLGPPTSTEQAWAGQPTRFGSYALRLWAPLLQHEVVSRR